jgi:hypothetical protein
MAETLEFYYSLVFLINYLVYLSYFLIKYIAAPILWFILERADRKKKEHSCLGKFARITRVMQSVILLIFGNQLAIKKNSAVRDPNNIPTMTLRRRTLSYGGTMVLFVLIITFGILAVGSALDIALLSVTHVCSENPTVDCFPQLLPGENDAGLNMTISLDEPVRDCSYWNSKGVTHKITFVCYQVALDGQKFLAIVGGLLSFFIYAMKGTITVMLFLSVWCLGGGREGEKNTKSKNCCRRCLCVDRIVVAIVLSIIEIVVAIVCLSFGASGAAVDTVHNSPDIVFAAKYAPQVLLVFGVMATLLWLPWEEYSKAYKEKVDAQKAEEHTKACKEEANEKKAIEKYYKTNTIV